MSSTNTGIPEVASKSVVAPISTVAAKPAQVNFTLPTWVLSVESLVKTHERIIIIGILAFTGWHFYSKGVDAWSSHESGKARVAATVVQTDDTATKAVQAQLSALQVTVAAQTATILKQVAQRNRTTVEQQTTDKTLAPPALAQRWQSLLHITSGIDPATGQQFAVTQEAASMTVVQLEEVPTLTANVASLQTELSNEQLVNVSQAQVISDLSTEFTDEKKSHVDDVNAEKAKTKKAFVKGFKFGAIVGFVGGLFLGHSL